MSWLKHRSEGFWWILAAIVVFVTGVTFLYVKWGWLSSSDPEESPGTTIRNAFLIIGGLDALLLALWRSRVSERQTQIANEQAKTALKQADIAHQGLLNDRCQKAAEMLGSSVLAVRMGGIYALERLSAEHPQQYHVRVMKLVCAFVQHPNKDANFPEEPEVSKGLVLRKDVQAAMEVIGARGDTHLRLAGREGYSIFLRGADLRGGDLRGLNLSSPSSEMIKSMSWHQGISNATLLTDLSGARLEGARFGFTDISGVDFSRNGKSPATGLKLSELLGAQWNNTNPPVLKGLIEAVCGRNIEEVLAESRAAGQSSQYS